MTLFRLPHSKRTAHAFGYQCDYGWESEKCRCDEKPSETSPSHKKTVEVLEQLPRVHERVFARMYRGSYVPLPLDLRIRNHRCGRESVYPWEGEDDDLHVGPHTFRHTLATRMAQYNIHVSKAQKLLGHSTTETTRSIYTHVEESQIHDDMERIPAPETMPRLRVVGEDE